MTDKNPTPLVYDDSSLSCIVQVVKYAVPWVNQPTPKDFVTDGMPNMEVPVMSWVIQDEELSWRERLIKYLNTLYGDDFSKPINGLPGNYITATLSNIFYNSRVYVDGTFTPRIDEELSTVSYAAGPYWIAFHVAGLISSELPVSDNSDAPYQRKQLSDLRRVLTYALNQTLTTTPVIQQSRKVIIAATKNDGERNTLYAENDMLQRWLAQGNNITKLCNDWLMNGINPTL